MSYIKLDPQPAALADGELALQLDDGTVVAVSVETKWLSNGSGVSMYGQARWIAADGTAQVDAHQQNIETSLHHNADAEMVKKFDVQTLSKDLIMALLGEPRDLVVFDPAEPARVMVPWSADTLANAQIRDHITFAKEAGVVTAAAALGL